MDKFLRAFIIVSLIGAIALVAAVFLFWLPPLQEYVIVLEGDLPILSALVYPFSALIAALSVASIAVAIAFPSAMKKDMIFSNATASKLSIISLLITLAGALIIICAVMLASIGDKLLFFPLLIISAIILLVAFMLNILSNYVKRAALLKEEVDATL